MLFPTQPESDSIAYKPLDAALTEWTATDQQHHILSHHGQDEDKIKQLQRIESDIVECFGRLLANLKNRKEHDSPMLQNTSVLFGSNLGNANAHDTRNLPILLAGGSFDHGKTVKHDQSSNTQLSNLLLAMLNEMGIEQSEFGQSTGALSW